MDLEVNEFMDGLLSEKAHSQPSDNVKVEDLDLEMRLPEWFDEEKYNKGRRFFNHFIFAFGASMTLGLLAVFSVPSILKVLVSTRRSSSVYTAYKRYVSTLMHIMSWFQCDLKPGTTSWQSLYTVRSRHLRAAKEATLKGYGTVSQRDLALTQFGFIGFAILKPDKLHIRQIRSGDWEGFNHFWRTIGYMLGLEDRYNICRKNIDETRKVCQIILDRVYTPCLENVPEYFEHMSHVLLEGLSSSLIELDPHAVLFLVRYLADVPGYVYTEEERIKLQQRLKNELKGKSEDLGVDSASLMSKCAIEGLPKRSPRLLYVEDFESLDSTPVAKNLSFASKFKIARFYNYGLLYNTEIGRILLNWVYWVSIILTYYFPYKSMFKFGFKNAFVNMFAEDPKDDTEPKPNSEYNKPPPTDTLLGKILTVLW